MTIKVLIIDPDIAFIVPLKRALETMGDYVVSGFASGKAALDHARRERYDIAVIDARVEDIALPLLVGALRSEQPRLPVLISNTAQTGGLNIQRTLPKPYYARQLGPMIREVLDQVKISEPLSTIDDTPIVPPVPGQALPGIAPHEPDDTFYRLVNAIQADDFARQRTIQSLNKVLRSLSTNGTDEPPIPENATIRDMVTGSSQPVPMTPPPESLEDTVPTTQTFAPPPTLPEEPPEDSSAELAAATLSVADDDTVPLDQLSLKAFMDTVKLRGPGLVPLIADALRMIDEPAFVSQVIRTAAEKSVSTSRAVPPVESPAVESTAPVQIEQPPTELPGEPAPAAEPIAETPPVTEVELLDITSPVEVELPSEAADVGEIPEPAEEAELGVQLEPEQSDEVAALAVQLTHLTINSTAQATLLTRDDKLIAAAGPLSGMPGIAEEIHRVWHSAGETGDTLIRNLFLPDVGDILLYSTLTLDGMRLSMLFPFDTPVKSIRKLARNLTAALSSVPEAPVDMTSELPVESGAERTQVSRPTDLHPPEGLPKSIASLPAPAAASAPPRATGPYAGYGFVLLPREGTLVPEITDTLIEALNAIAEAHQWTMEGTEIQPGYVSIQISIPANETAATTVEILMRDTATRAGDAELWADGYYVVTPGRPITSQEIAQFVEYQHGAA